MSRKALLGTLLDATMVHTRAWLFLYLISIITPFLYILLLSYNDPGKTIPLLFDLPLTLTGIFCIIVTIQSVVKMFWTAINTNTLTSEKITRLMLTYIYMLFAFAGIYLVLYFDSDFSMVSQALMKQTGASSSANPLESLAFSGVSRRFWPAPSLPIEWTNLPVIYVDMLYFSASTMTTLGFGDIVAKYSFVKILVIIQALFGNLLLVLGVASIVPRQKPDSQE